MIEAEGLGISQYHVLPWALDDILQKNSLSDGNDCVICSDTVPSLLEIRVLELKRSNGTERSSKWVVSPGQRTVPAQLCVSGPSAHPNSPGFGLHSYISGKYTQNHGQSWFLTEKAGRARQWTSVRYLLPFCREAKRVSYSKWELVESKCHISFFWGVIASAQGKRSKASAAVVVPKSRANVETYSYN